MKKYFKKSFSLMLAVLMVLSCWVWIAPTKAEAATAGNYYVEVTWNASRTGATGTPQFDEDNDGSSMGFKFDYVSDNGQGETTGSYIYNCAGGAASTDNKATFTLSGFPTKLWVEFDWGTIFESPTFEIKTIKIGPNSSNLTTIFNGVITMDSSTNCKMFTIDYKGATYTNDEDNARITTASTAKWELPKPTSIAGLGGTTNITIPEVGSTTVLKNNFTAVVKDQYGVNWYQAPESYKLTNSSTGTTELSNEDSGFWWTTYNTDGATVNVSAQMQDTLRLSEGNTKDYYLVASHTENNGTATGYQTLRITYPKYDWTFYGNGNGTVATSPTTKIEMAGTLVEDGTYPNSYDNDVITSGGYKAYGQSIKDYYPVTATKEGYTFYGFWTKQQPTTGTSEPYSFESDFIQPIDTDTYNTMTEEQQAFYYPAGEKYDPKDASCLETTKDEIYYAWWLSDDITVKFYDINGKFLDSADVKYGYDNTYITWPTPQESYVSGSYSYSNWTGTWENIDGEEVDADGYTFTHDLILTPKYNTVSFTDEYNVTVYNTYGRFGSAYTKTYAYRDTAAIPAESQVTALPADAEDYSYTFEGWSTSAPSDEDSYTSGNYHVMVEDGNFDETGRAVYLVTDFTVRDNVSYYPVFRRHTKSYDVSFTYMDSTGTLKTVTKNFKYGEVITAPDGVPTEYATGGYGYTFQGWNKNNVAVNLSGEECVPGLAYAAYYSDGVPTPYTVTFVYRNEKGEEVTKTAQVNHGSLITQDTVDSLAPYENYDDGEYMLTFNGKWTYETTDGTQTVTTADLVNVSPKNHLTVTAVYENPVPFYTVTYKDGATTKAYRITQGTVLPYWTYEVAGKEGEEPTQETYLPARADTVEGKYTFIGWFDAEEGGNQYVPGETEITSNVTLYPQFSFGKFEYHIVFVNYDGSELARGTFNYRDDVTALTDVAKAAAVKAADDTYTYQFIGWDKKVPTTCEGGEPDSTLTFTAQYKSVYIYYNVEWYNGIDEDGNLEGDVLATSKYVYGDKMHTPSVALTVPENTSGTDQKYVFAGWYYKDAAGEEHQFTRNLTLTKDIMDESKVVKMYAKYALTDLTWKVTVVIDEKTSYDFTVTNGANIKDLVSNPASGYVDKTSHNAFTGWTTGAVGGTEFDIDNATITDDTKIYANFHVSEHVYSESEVTKVPTYPIAELKDANGNVLVEASDGRGEYVEWCACNRTETVTETKYIAALSDGVAPTGTGYIGTQWKTGDEIKTVYANLKTDLIITTTDKGDVNNLYNTTGKGIGVQTIYACILDTATEITEDDVYDEDGNFSPTEGAWTEVYNWTQIQTSLIEYYESWEKVPEIYKDYNANVTAKLGNYPLSDGSQYIAYAVIVDKEGNKTFMQTAPFIYDATVPAVELSGDSNYSGDKFCESIEVVAVEANTYTVTANGKEVTANDEGKYIITGVGYYNIVVEDAAGNKVNKYAEIIGSHNLTAYTQAATCFEDGLTSDRCTVCGKDFNKTVIDATGHSYEFNEIAATCTVPGYIEAVCANCDNTAERQYYKTNEDGSIATDDEGNQIILYPATGHTYDKNLDGKADEGATGVVGKAATCQKTGVMNYICDTCGEKLSEEIAIDNDAHNFYTQVLVKPTCTQAGYATKTCRYCGVKVVSAQGSDSTAANYDSSLAPTGHDAGAYVVTTAATCKEDGVETLKCTVCNATIQKTNDEDTLVDVTRAISKDTVAHTWQAQSTVEPTETEKGYTVYKCSVCGTEKNGDYVDILTKYTVVIYNDAGEELHNAKYTAGDTLPAGVVEDQTKANSEDGKTKYTFVGWYTKKSNGDWDSQVKLGSAVNGNLKLYPKFTESSIYYTLKFKAPTKYDADKGFTDYVVVKELMGAIGDSRVPSATPTMAEDDYYTYEFQGWTKAGVEFDDNTAIVVGGDATYEAVFTAKAKTFDVIFMNEGVALGKVSVVSGEDAEYTGEDPTKAPDADYHYEWTGWDGSLKNIAAKTTVKATYKAIAHDWKVVEVSQKADCVLPELTDYKCEECGKTKTEQTAPANGHKEGDPVLDKSTGEYVVSCTECEEEIRRTDATFTISFVNENGSGLGTIYVELNGEVAYTGATPTKDQTSEYRYTFAGWEAEDGTKYGVDTDLPAATKDAKYKAYYTAEKRTYRVSYADSSNKILYSVTDVAYGAAVPEYAGDTDVNDIAVPAYTNDVHYVFDKWDVSVTTVTGNLLIRPKFKSVDHTVVKQGETTATCTQPGGIKWACTDGCGYEYIDGNVPVIAHDWVLDVANSYEPDYLAMTPGLHVYTCSYGCGNTKEEVIPVTMRVINITVKDQNGNAIKGAQVDIYKDGEWVDIQYSDASGCVVFYVKEEGTYTVIVSGVDDADNLQYDITVGANGYDDNGKSPAVNVIDCSCACHRDGFWGSIFRFFHKIIKLFTGEFNCCGCPDERYN